MREKEKTRLLLAACKQVVSQLRGNLEDGYGISPQMALLIDDCERAICKVEGRKFRSIIPLIGAK